MALINKSQQVNYHRLLSLNIELGIHCFILRKNNGLFMVFYLDIVAAEKSGNPAEDEDDQHQLRKEMNSACNINGNSHSSGKEEKSNLEESELPERYEL